jgi:hypothetical protein
MITVLIDSHEAFLDIQCVESFRKNECRKDKASHHCFRQEVYHDRGMVFGDWLMEGKSTLYTFKSSMLLLCNKKAKSSRQTLQGFAAALGVRLVMRFHSLLNYSSMLVLLNDLLPYQNLACCFRLFPICQKHCARINLQGQRCADTNVLSSRGYCAIACGRFGVDGLQLRACKFGSSANKLRLGSDPL